MSNKCDAKVVILGRSDVGKTCFMERYLRGRFVECTPTVGAAFGAKVITKCDRSITLGLWDTAGSERYQSMSAIYYRSAFAAVICFDLTNAASFEKLKFWCEEVRVHEPDCLIFICGTKCDLVVNDFGKRAVDPDTVEQFVKELDTEFFETSAITGEGLENVFNRIAEEYMAVNPERVNVDRTRNLSSMRTTGAGGKKNTCC